MNIDSDTMIYCITLQKSLEILCRTLVLIKSSDTQYIYTYALKVSMPFWKRLMENFGNFADGGGMLTLDGKKIIFHRELACRPRPLICPKCRKYHTFWA